MTTIPDGKLVESGNGKPSNDLESARFTKDKETVDVMQPTAKLIGLTKEQLEQYRNDPFWKTVRYALFIAFWLVWLLMFVGAILIVVLSPKCVEVKWPNKMVAYKVFSLAFKDSDTAMDGNAGFGDFMGMKEKLGDLKDMGVNTVWPTPVLNFDKNGLTGEMTVSLDVAEQLGGQEKFKELVKSAHAKDMKVVVDLPLTVADGEDNWVKKRGIQNGLEQGKGKIAPLNLKIQQIQEALVGLARDFVVWGIDGLNLADYGFADIADLTTLADKIRTQPGADQIPIYIEKSTATRDGYNYKVDSLVDNGKAGKLAELVRKMHEKIAQSKLGPNSTETTPTIWTLGSLNSGGHRLDELVEDQSLSPSQKGRVSTLFSLVQLFVPGPAGVIYGEELGLLSGKTSGDKKPNLVVYPWDNSSRYTEDNQFLAVPQNAASSNYASQLGDGNSPLGVFTKIAKLHQQNDFLLGDFSHSSLGGLLDLYLVRRHPSSLGTYYGLVVNWAGEEKVLSAAELPAGVKGKKFTIKASTDGGMAQIELGEENSKVKIPGYGALAFQTD